MKNTRRFIGLLLVVLLLMAPILALADENDEVEETLTISGEGVELEIVFTRAELEAMDTEQHVYSAINSFPTPSVVHAVGVPLDVLLEEAGLLDTAQIINFIGSDGFRRTFTVAEMLEPRFYFPEEGDPVPVPAMVCIEYGDSLESLEPTILRFVFGQRAASDQNNGWFVRFLATIEVTTDEPQQWAPVTFEEEFGEDGLLLHLGHPQFDSVKIHYTLDGSDPTVESAMYNPSATRFQPELNVPIEITEETVVRAIAIGYSRLDSVISETTVSPDGPVFTDLEGYEWAIPAIRALAADGIIRGVGGGLYDPAGTLNRAMLVTIMSLVLRDENEAPEQDAIIFPDVDYDDWYGEHVTWGQQKGFIGGYDDGTFRPYDPLTIQQMIYLAVIAGLPDAELTEEAEALTIIGVDNWAMDAVRIAEMNGMLLRGVLADDTEDGIVVYGSRQAIRAELALVAFGVSVQG